MTRNVFLLYPNIYIYFCFWLCSLLHPSNACFRRARGVTHRQNFSRDVHLHE